MFRDLRLRHLAVAQLTLSRHSSSKLVSALDLRQFRLAVRRADDFALDSLVTFWSSRKWQENDSLAAAKLLADTNNSKLTQNESSHFDYFDQLSIQLNELQIRLLSFAHWACQRGRSTELKCILILLTYLYESQMDPEGMPFRIVFCVFTENKS